MSLPSPAVGPSTSLDEDAQYYRQALHSLIDMGMDIARTLHAEATSPETPAREASAAAFDRVARTVRRCVLLARKVAEPLPPAPNPLRERTAARGRIIREVEDTIVRTADGERAEALRAEFAERLDAPDVEDDIRHRPVAEVVADIKRDLGLIGGATGKPYYKRRTPAEVAALRAQAAAPPTDRPVPRNRTVRLLPVRPERLVL